MKKILIGILIFIILIAAIAGVLLLMIPAESFKVEILRHIERVTGRQVRIDGPVKLSVFPTLALEAHEVGIGNPAWAGKTEMITAKRMDVGVRLMPLLSKRLEMTGFTLESPTVHLIKQGNRANWQFGDSAQAKPEPAKSPEAEGMEIPQLILSAITVNDGRFSYTDMTTKKSYVLQNVDVTLDVSTLDDPVDLTASGEMDGKMLKLDAKLESPSAALAGTPSTTTLDAKIGDATWEWDGKLALLPRASGSGRGSFKVSDLKQWLPAETASSPVIPASLSFTGITNIEQTSKVTTLTIKDGVVNADDLQAMLNLDVRLGGRVPAIQGSIAFDELNLDPYLPESKGNETAANGGDAKEPQAITWSSTPIDVSALKALQANLKITAKELQARKTTLQPFDATISLKDGLLKLLLAQTSFYGGSLAGSATVDGRREVPGAALNVALEGVQAEPLLKDFADFKRLTGTLRGGLNVHATGESQKAMVSTLQGNGNVIFTDGAIKGINLAAMMRNVKSAFNPGTDTGTQQTDFSELSGTFAINSGVVNNNDLALKSPFLRVHGAGNIDLPAALVNYRLTPELVNTSKGQGGKEDIQGLQVPVIVSGPLHHPRFQPDLKGMVTEGLKDPEKLKANIKGAEETVKGVRDQLKELKDEDKLKDAVKGLLGN